ncbi:hypothetical protein [Propylenella binzhouense]|uniref:Alpha/beta hydrolase n=1 Tax=Propylenella binzhouense TaxID=2555902 RepID=A0A964T3X1_9HYPH|nr:hypothetical protein [Propylenella binzhouense]MYZ47925.1 hypothetical protein [Propylenella binzhouense]
MPVAMNERAVVAPDRDPDSAETTLARVRRRHVLYLSGFDPRGPAFYHRLYRSEAARRAEATGERIEVGRRKTTDPLVQTWTVKAEIGGMPTETRYDFLRWDDIIRAHWPRSQVRIWLDSLWAYWTMMRTGVIGRSGRISWPLAITGSLAALYILLQVALAVLAAWCIWTALAAFGTPEPLRWAASLAAVAAVLVLGHRYEKRLNVYWLGRIYAFTVRDARDRVAGLEDRRDAFARMIVEAVNSGDADEVLVVGHSLGTPLAVSAAARALRIDPGIAGKDTRLAVLTLGTTVSMLSLMPEAERFRREVRELASSDVPWLDFSAPTDGACYAMVDPVRIFDPSFVRPDGREAWPKLLNMRMAEIIEAKTYARIKRDWARMHFQYLMAGDRRGEYDFFAITAGPLTLPGRYAHRQGVKDYAGLKLFRR